MTSNPNDYDLKVSFNLVTVYLIGPNYYVLSTIPIHLHHTCSLKFFLGSQLCPFSLKKTPMNLNVP